jgi:hypothetical protein
MLYSRIQRTNIYLGTYVPITPRSRFIDQNNQHPIHDRNTSDPSITTTTIDPNHQMSTPTIPPTALDALTPTDLLAHQLPLMHEWAALVAQVMPLLFGPGPIARWAVTYEISTGAARADLFPLLWLPVVREEIRRYRAEVEGRGGGG